MPQRGFSVERGAVTAVRARPTQCAQVADLATAKFCQALVASPIVVEFVAAVALTPWAHPLRFQPLPGWQRGANGTFNSSYGPGGDVASPKESTAWMVKGVRYRDPRTADPPTATLSRLPRAAIVVFAVVYESAQVGRRIKLRLDDARRYPCCDGTYVPGGEFALTGGGPGGAYSVIVRIYFGSPPTRSTRRQAQRAIDRLSLPLPR